MARIKFKKGMSITKVGMRITTTVLGLYVAGELLSAIGTAMNSKTSPFFNGLTLIGWTVNDSGTITSVTQTAPGLLSVVGIAAIASVVMSFVNIKL